MQRLYVRSILESVYSSTETDQIIATAAHHAISVLDAAIALRVNAGPLQIVAAALRRSRPVKSTTPAMALKTRLLQKPATSTTRVAFVLNKDASVHARSGALVVNARHAAQQLFLSTQQNTLTI